MTTNPDAAGSAPEPTTEIDPRTFRTAMGRFATGITIITTVAADGQVHGMTANGFLSISLTPPLVLISLGECRMASLLRTTGTYGVSVLADQQKHYSRHFAGQSRLTLEPDFTWQAGIPFIHQAVAHIGADIVDVHPAGDHTLFIGKVTHLSTHDGRPLIFHGGDYEVLRHRDEQEIFFV
jgi:flavin reductase (DIM6/NTAB) family NADH-FMN oxidoreductase RutF